MQRPLALLCICAAILSATPREMNVVPASGILLDGHLRESCWTQGQWQTHFTTFQGATVADNCRFKALADSKGLFIGIDVTDDSIKSQPRREQDSIWHDDSIEICIAPESSFPEDPNVQEYHHYILNADNGRFTEYRHGGVAVPGKHPYWASATQRTSKGYSMELFFPWYIFPGAKESCWRIQVLHTNYVNNEARISVWSPTANLHNPLSFGLLKGIQAPVARHAIELQTLKTVRTANGHAVEFCADFSHGELPNCLYATVLFEKESVQRDFGDFTRKRFAIDAAGKKSSGLLPVNLPDSGKYRMTFLLEDEIGTLLRTSQVQTIQFAMLTTQLTHPVYRNAIYATDAERSINATIQSAYSPEEATQNTLLVRLKEAKTGKILKESKVNPIPAILPYKLKIEEVPYGEYILENLVITPSGKTSHQGTQPIFILPPAPGNELRIDTQHRLVLNGKPFFLLGFMGIGNDANSLDDVEKAGGNTVHSYNWARESIPNILKYLDRCQAHGQKAIFYAHHQYSCGFWGFHLGNKKYTYKVPPDYFSQMDAMIDAVKAHPAFLGYYLFDEPRGGEWLETLKQIYQHIRNKDPYHPVFGCDNGSEGCIAEREHCDIAIFDMYMAPFYKGNPRRSIASIGAAMENVARQLGNSNLLIACPQAFDGNDFAPRDAPREVRPPTYEECRGSAYVSLISGAEGILPYKIGDPAVSYYEKYPNAGIYCSPELKIGYLEGILPELKTLASFFTAPVRSNYPAPNGARARLYQRDDGKLLLAIINPAEKPITISLSLPQNCTRGFQELSGVSYTANKQSQTLKLAPYEVALFTTDLTIKLPSTPAQVRAKINREPKLP